MVDFTITEEIKDFNLKDYQEFINFTVSKKDYEIYQDKVEDFYYLHDLKSNRLHKFKTNADIVDQNVALEIIEKFDTIRHLVSY